MQVAGGVGGMLSTTVGSDTYYPVFDANGNIMYYLDNNADTVASYTYDPFGSIHAQSGGRVDVFSYKFSTKPQDDVSGLYYYGFRFYDPVNGRWPSKDPIRGTRRYKSLSLHG
jgi:RHS repeat-associated protein